MPNNDNVLIKKNDESDVHFDYFCGVNDLMTAIDSLDSFDSTSNIEIVDDVKVDILQETSDNLPVVVKNNVFIDKLMNNPTRNTKIAFVASGTGLALQILSGLL